MKGFEHLVNLLSGHLVGLCSRPLEGVNLGEGEPRKAARDVIAASLARLVLIEHDKDLAGGVGVCANQFLLSRGEAAPHEGNNALHPKLPELHAIEEPFDDNERAVGRLRDGPVQVEQLNGLFEALGETILLLVGCPRPAARIGDQLAGGIVDRSRLSERVIKFTSN